MAKKKVENKLTDEQLEKLQTYVNTANRIQLTIGGLEAQKHEWLHKLTEVKEGMDVFQKELEAQYGDVQIDLQTGVITENAGNS